MNKILLCQSQQGYRFRDFWKWYFQTLRQRGPLDHESMGNENLYCFVAYLEDRIARISLAEIFQKISIWSFFIPSQNTMDQILKSEVHLINVVGKMTFAEKVEQSMWLGVVSLVSE